MPEQLRQLLLDRREIGGALRIRLSGSGNDGAVETMPILSGCGRYPAVLFVHGDCGIDPNHYMKWVLRPAQLARAGCVVVVPRLPSGAAHPSAEGNPIVRGLTSLPERAAVAGDRTTATPPERLVRFGREGTSVPSHGFRCVGRRVAPARV